MTAKPIPSPILVTGAGGSVGALLVDALLSRGEPVRATDRPGAPAALPREGLEWREADLTRPEAVPPLLRGVRAVIHTAAWVDIAAPFAAQAPINLHAVRRLYEAAAEAGVETFLHFSSGSIYAPKDGSLVETDVLRPGSGYEWCKLLAEDYLRARAGQGPRVAMLRPALIYGPRGKVLVSPLATLPRLFARLDGLVPGLEGGPRTNLVHALDCARAAIHLLDHPQPDGAVFNVASPDVLDGGELMATVLRLGGLRQLPVRVPYPGDLVRGLLPFLRYPGAFAFINRGAGWLWDRVVRDERLAPELAPRVDLEATAYLGGDTVFDSSKLVATGFEFRYPTFEAGWRQTVQWYRDHGWLPAQPAVREAA